MDQERKAFEAAILAANGQVPGNYNPEYDRYVSERRQGQYEGWKLARAQVSQGGEAVEVVASIAVDAEGVVRDFTLEPGLDRHPGGYTVTPLMTVAQHQRIMAASVGSAEPVAWRVTGRDGLTVTAQYPEWAEADCLLLITPLYTHPADQVDGVVVSRELLERIVKRGMRLPDDTQRQHLGELRALLAKP